MFSRHRYPTRANSTFVPSAASEKQLAFIDRLSAERGEAVPTDNLDSRAASALINHLLTLPVRRPVAAVTEPGIYADAAGNVYKVQKSKGGDGIYAKRLAPIGGERLTDEGQVVSWEFVYAPGAIKLLKPENRLSLDEAKAFGIKYGVCVVCGKGLSDAKSVALGIGPVCIKRV